MNNLLLFAGSAVVGYIAASLIARDVISHHAGGSVNGWFTLTSPTTHGGACTANSAGCICSDVHKCTPDASIAGVNLFKQGWLPAKPASCRPDLTVYGKNYFDSNCCPDGTYGGPPRPGPFSVSCRGVQGTGAGYKGAGAAPAGG